MCVFVVFQVEQTSGEENAVLSIPVSKRSDTGKYTITLSNKFGEDAGDLNINVLGESTLCVQSMVTGGTLVYTSSHSCLGIVSYTGRGTHFSCTIRVGCQVHDFFSVTVI